MWAERVLKELEDWPPAGYIGFAILGFGLTLQLIGASWYLVNLLWFAGTSLLGWTGGRYMWRYRSIAFGRPALALFGLFILTADGFFFVAELADIGVAPSSTRHAFFVAGAILIVPTSAMLLLADREYKKVRSERR